MSFDSSDLQADILELFEERAHAVKFNGITYAERGGYSTIRSVDEQKEVNRQWRLDNADYIASVEFREAAKRRVGEWRAAQMADPVKAKRLRSYRKKHSAAYWKRTKPTKEAKTAYRHSRRECGRSIWDEVALLHGELTSQLLVARFGMWRSRASQILYLMCAEGKLERVRYGVYRRSK